MKSGYSLKPETIDLIQRISTHTYRSKSAVIDMAVALLAEQVFSEDGEVDLPARTPTPKAKRPTRKTANHLNPTTIPGVHRGLKQLTLEAA